LKSESAWPSIVEVSRMSQPSGGQVKPLQTQTVLTACAIDRSWPRKAPVTSRELSAGPQPTNTASAIKSAVAQRARRDGGVFNVSSYCFCFECCQNKGDAAIG
jgi:hypothetical protein